MPPHWAADFFATALANRIDFILPVALGLLFILLLLELLFWVVVPFLQAFVK